MHKKTIRDIDVKGKRILVRVDYNVPVKDGAVTDDFRIQASLPTLQYLLEQECSLVLMSHLGEPKGKPDATHSLRPVAAKASELLNRPIAFHEDCIGEAVLKAARDLRPGEVMMLENVRFHQPELDNDPGFARQLANLGDIYVNDAFAVDHRDQASVSGVAKYLPAVAGLLVEKEVEHIRGALDKPNRPLVAIIGGAKVSTKIELLNNLIPKVDVLLLGGAMANTFLLAGGREIGKSLAEPDYVNTAKQLIELAKREDTQLFLPEEVVVSKSTETPKHLRTVKVSAVEPDDYIVDVSPEFPRQLSRAVYEFLDFDNKSTVIWNGPLGLTEVPEFAAGSLAMAGAIVALPGEISVIGGGDTAGFVDEAGRHDQFSWVSTGGGASLALMAGKQLPGIEALQDK